MREFLSTWYGMAAFIAFDIAVVIVIIAVNYKWLTKRFLDIVISAVCLIVTSPLTLALVIAAKAHNSRHNEYKGIFDKKYYIGKKGKVIALHEFSHINAIDGSESKFGRIIKKFSFIPALFDVISGRLSIVGPMPLRLYNESLISDEHYRRFDVRPGIINPLIVRGRNETRSYEKMFRADIIYADKLNLFKDIRIFFTWVVLKIRGVKDNRIGVANNVGYAENLLSEGKITKEEFDETFNFEESVLRKIKKRREFKKEMSKSE